MPLVSILIPTYNRENLIGETIDSALKQSVKDIEIIVVDNNSTDLTTAVALEYMKTDQRIRVYKNESNIGPVLNWIRCAQLSTSPYSKILFSDDLMAQEYLEQTLPYLIDPECACVYTSALIGAGDWQGGLAYNAFIGNAKVARNTFIRMGLYCDGVIPVSPGAALFRTQDLLSNIKVDLQGITDYDFRATGAGVDWLLYMLTALNYSYVQYVDKPLSYFRAHSESLTIKNEGNSISIGQVLAKQWLKAALGLP